MYDLSKEKAMCWNIRLKKYIDASNYTQVSFSQALNNKYGTCYSQKDVSRWLNIGAKIKSGKVGFPKYETMLLIADFIHVDVGYLIGETNEVSFSLEKACSYMGLNGEAINAIREITHPDNESSYIRKDMSDSLNTFLSAEKFPIFSQCLFDLYLTSISPNRLEKRVFENINSAIDYTCESEYTGKIERYELNEALVLLINEIYPVPSLSNLNIKE